MLGSITPLGERSRGSRWWLTATAYVLGSSLAGLATGGLFGVLGSVTFADVPVEARLVLLAAGVVVGLLLDLHVFGLSLPTVHRQVDEAWRTSYRGWVWGLGFGLQLGTGVVTIVTSSTIYATWLAAMLTGDVAAGALVGVAFGLARSLPVLTVSGVRRPEQLLRVDGRLSRLARPAQRVTYAASGALAAISVAGAARW